MAVNDSFIFHISCIITLRGNKQVVIKHYKRKITIKTELYSTGVHNTSSTINPYAIVCIFFHWHNPSSRTMALGLTHPLT